MMYLVLSTLHVMHFPFINYNCPTQQLEMTLQQHLAQEKMFLVGAHNGQS